MPKFLTITPDQSRIIVSDWCSYDVAVIDTATAKVVKRVSVGPYTRGIAISRDSRIAYVAIMGGRTFARSTSRPIAPPGWRPAAAARARSCCPPTVAACT